MEPMLRERANRSGRGARRLPRRLATALAAIVAIGAALAAAACGGDDAPSKAQPTANQPTSVATTAVAASPTTAPAAVAKETAEKLTVGGVEREAVVYVPAKLSAAKAPVVVMLVSPGDPITPVRSRYGILIGDEADRLGFIAVFPTGTPSGTAQGAGGPTTLTWNNGNVQWGAQQPPDDIAFFKALLDVLVARYPVDADRISFTGHNAGTVMSYRVACELSDRIAAFAAVGVVRDNTTCQSARAMSMLHMHGTAAAALYGGGVLGSGVVAPPVTDVIEYWRKLDGCTGEAAVTMLTAVTEQRRYGPCKGGTEVVLITVKDGAGGWWGNSGPAAQPGSGAGTGDPALKATPIVVEFLIKQTKAGR